MSTKRRAYTAIKLPGSRKEEAEFGKGKKSAFICKQCGACYYLKAWHHSFENISARRNVVLKNFRPALCPACTMMKHGQYEGKVIIRNAPLRIKDGLLALIRSFGDKAFQRDCQHRVIGVSSQKGLITVTTSENQLAAKLAKKIKETFPVQHMRIAHATLPSDVQTAEISFTPLEAERPAACRGDECPSVFGERGV